MSTTTMNNTSNNTTIIQPLLTQYIHTNTSSKSSNLTYHHSPQIAHITLVISKHHNKKITLTYKQFITRVDINTIAISSLDGLDDM